MRAAIAEALAALSVVFDHDLTEAKSALYAQALAPFTDAQIRTAAEGAINTCQFFPKPAELRELIPGPDALPGYVPGAGLLPPRSYPPPTDYRRIAGAVDTPDHRQPRSSDPEAMAAVLDRVMPELRAHGAALKAEREKPQTLDEVAAAKAKLREQLALLKKQGAA